MRAEPPGGATNLRRDAHGIWTTQSSSAISYPEDGNDLCFSIERDSFWFMHRNAVILDVLQRFPPPGVFYDIGGGNGFVAAAAAAAGWPTVLVEPGRSGAEHAVQRGIDDVVCATTESAGFLPATFPAVGLFDVVEHIENDVDFLASIRHLMRPGGRVYLTVPAFQMLWSQEDTSAGHYRRYTARSLANVLKSAGFEIEYQTYFFFFLPLPVFLLRTLPSWIGQRKTPTAESASREHTAGGLANRVVGKLLDWERRRLQRGAMTVGGSCLAVARVPT